MTTDSVQKQGSPQSIKQIIVPLVTIIIGLFMVILDNTVVNVALQTLRKDFHSSLSTIQWTVTGYMLAQAAVIPLAGWLSDRFGSKNIFLISLGLFTVGSLLCGLAGSDNELIIFRVFQGLGGGMVMPIAMAFTYRLSPPNKVGAVMGMMGVPILLAPAIGPVLSGFLVDHTSWRWIFMINLPIGVIGMILGIFKLPKIEKSAVAALDMLGMLLGPAAFAMLAYGISEGSASWSSVKTITGLSAGAVALVLFVMVELLRKKQPLLELRVFRSWSFSKGIIVQWISQIALFGTIFLIPQFLQTAKGFNAFHSGLTVLPQAIAAGIFMPIGGRLYDRFGARPVVLFGMSLVTCAAFLLSRVADSGGSSTAMILPLVMLGSGMGMFMMPLNTHLIQASPQNLVSRVTSLTSAMQQIMNSFAVAGLTTILAGAIKKNMDAGEKNAMVLNSAYSHTFLVVVTIAAAGVLLSVLLTRPVVEEESGDETENAADHASEADAVAFMGH